LECADLSALCYSFASTTL